MSKFHKRSKTRKGLKRKQKTKNFENVQKIEELRLKYKNADAAIEVLETPFGEVMVNDRMLVDNLKSKRVLFKLLKIDEAIKEDDVLSRLIYLEKIKDQHPNEPFIAHEIAICYEDMEEWEKYNKTVEENYEKHQGYPSIDISYVAVNFDEYDKDIAGDIFGEELNIHQIYPRFKAFDSEMVVDFYATLSTIYKNRNELSIARKCAEIVKGLDDFKGQILEKRLDLIENPWLKRKIMFSLVILVLVILSVVVGIIWGIISFFQWIF